jgi:hypothetical protein
LSRPKLLFGALLLCIYSNVAETISTIQKNTIMKKITLIILSLIASLFGAFAQNKSVEGNGNFKAELKTLEPFSKVFVNMHCDINITTGGMPMADIISDKNIISLVKLEVKNQVLIIETKSGYWLQNERPMINISVAYINELTTYGQQTGIGTITVSGIDVDEFKLDIFYGNIILEGKANSMNIKSSNNGNYSNSGKIDASALVVKSVNADIEGSNSAIVNVTEKLSANLRHDARINYKGNPTDISLSGKAEKIGQGTIAVENNATKPIKSDQNEVAIEYVSVSQWLFGTPIF